MAMMEDLVLNPCCAKLRERCHKLEEGREALRRGIKLYRQQFESIETDNLKLKKAYEEESVLADVERQEKEKEALIRVSLENEISALKSEILSLQQKEGPRAQVVDGELILLQTRVSEGKTEINRLKELLEKERTRADSERKKADAEKKKTKEAWKMLKAEKSKADEERRLGKLEESEPQESRILLETLKREADEARSKLVVKTFKSVEGNKELDAEREKEVKVKQVTDAETAKAEEQKKLVEIYKEKAMDEKHRADYMSQQWEEDRRRIEKLQKDMRELISSRKFVEAPADISDVQINAKTASMKGGLQLEELKRGTAESTSELEYLKFEEGRRRLEIEKQRSIREKKRADSETKKAEEQRKIAEVSRKKAMEQKHLADQLAQQLVDKKRKIDELQDEIKLLTKRVLQASVVPFDKNMNAENAKMKLLKKQLKFEKMRVRHAKQVAKLEIERSTLLQQELCRLKQDVVQFSHRLNALDNYFSNRNEGIDDLAKTSNISNVQSLNLKRELFTVEPYKMHIHDENELVKSNCTSMDASKRFKQTIECTAPLLPTPGGNCTESISGIDSKLEPLLRGSARTMLQSSTINSSTASFSDGQLVRSQERGAFSVTTAAAKLVEEKLNSHPTISSLSGEVTKTRYNENLAVVAENSVRSPKVDATVGKRAGHGKKRERITDAVECIEHLYSEGKKWHLRVEEKLSVLHGMLLNGPVYKPLEGRPHLALNMRGNSYAQQERSRKKRKASSQEEVALEHHLLCDDSDERRNWLERKGIEETNYCNKATPPANNILGSAQGCIDEISDTVRSEREVLAPFFEQVADGAYMKLLDLDNAADEECYRVAIETPLSPNLPDIEFRSSETSDCAHAKHLADKSDEGFSREIGLAPSGSFDVINVEIFSNELKLNTTGTSFTPICDKTEVHIDSLESITNNEISTCNVPSKASACDRQLRDSGAELEILYTSTSGNESPKVLCESGLASTCDDHPRFCVAFSDIKDRDSISRIFHATKPCMVECSMTSQTDWVVWKILPALLKVEDLSTKERVCVFFSLLLHSFCGIAFPSSGSFLNKDSILLLNSFDEQIRTVLFDVEARGMFAELCRLDELLILVEDFLIHRRVLRYSDTPSEPLVEFDSRFYILQSGADTLSFQMASTQQLVGGGVVLASLCVAADQISFICEASCNIFRVQKFDPSLMMNILHVFAYLCGSKYFTHNEYSLSMAVLKSLVTFSEREHASTGCAYCLQSETPCSECPFSEGAVSVNGIIMLLFEKLQNYALAGTSTTHQDLRESVNLLTSGSTSQEKGIKHQEVLCVLCMNCNTSSCLDTSEMLTIYSTSVFDETMCPFTDVLSLVELVACYMGWDWAYNNIVCQLLKMLESCAQECILAAILILLGQLGRLGVYANGYEDIGVENLRSRLSAFLCQNMSRKTGHCLIQIATVTALLALISQNFEEIIKSNSLELPADVSQIVPADCIRKWFFLLTCEQQTLSFSLLLSPGIPSCRTG